MTDETTRQHPPASDSPCKTCQTSPCCVHLPLHTLQIASLADLDHALYVLGFDNIVMGLAANGEFSVYYLYPCRFLKRSEPGPNLCSIHNDPLQPNICVNYNPYTCWYRSALTGEASPGFIPLDRKRMERLVEHIELDEQGVITRVPDWDRILELATEPLDRTEVEPGEDPVFARWLSETALGESESAPPRRYRALELADPCNGCAAYCCKTLVFPQAPPTDLRRLDFFQFMLGFPGLELGIADDQWMIVVRTRCRHLTPNNRCGVYNRPERPKLCRYFDATGCSYVAQFGRTRPRDFLRVQLEQFFWVTEALGFDEDGQITECPSVSQLCALVEERWRAEVATAAAEADAQEAAGTVKGSEPFRKE